jgi:DNA-binding SARP family transcriptional activator
VDVRLLGPVEARVGDQPLELGPRKQRAVLAMLALQVGRTVPAHRLAEGLWGDERPPSAQKMVQLYVSHLRRVLEGNGARIVTRGGGYELQLGDGAVDATRFEELLDAGRAREALGLWRGEALADVADEPFAAAEIRRLDELRLRAAECAIDVDLAAGRHAEVTGELDALVGQQPLREHLHAQRMLALYRSGRQADSLQAYQQARDALVTEIGAEPGTELRRLQGAILAHDPALDRPTSGATRGTRLPAPPRPPPRAATSGRRVRIALLASALLLFTGVTAFGLIRVIGPEGLPGISEDAVGVIDPDGGHITAQYAVGRGPGAVVSGAGSVWVANELDGTVSRIDRDRQIGRIPVGGAPAALAFGGGSPRSRPLWPRGAAPSGWRVRKPAP